MQKVHPATATPSVLLTVAGFDPSSGAGVTADLKVFAAHGCFGLSCPTVLTVQSTQGVRRSEPVSPGYMRDTLNVLAEDMPIAGVKVGALGNARAVSILAGWLGGMRTDQPQLPIVLDPVLRASSGTLLLDGEAEGALMQELLPLVTAVTPNLDEARQLAGNNTASVEGAAAALRARMRPGSAVVLTGGHGLPTPDDYLLEASGAPGRWFPGDWVRTTSTHGTGCAFSSALLCALVRGLPMTDAVHAAKRYVQEALRAAYPLGKGRGPLHHLYAFRERREEG